MGDNRHSALPPNWEVRRSTTYNRDYYFNTTSGESRWDAPTPRVNKKMRASHILAKHVDSRRPSSWRQENITLTKEEALKRIEEFREKIGAGESVFADIAKVESDCSSAKHGGDLGWFEEGKMQPAFEKGVLTLEVGEMSKPVWTDSGVHIILRTG
ncbi:peptidyl-prolyl cis-trans isomerase Pin1 [Kickxella alabastrina]|uniref:Peptidyl-prolyl cis-trans isomerase Pin1 n=1 Tax=Kickxella alabastrina TaxID=61397 RepID=A0ACC1ID50_9FUNG|nr:peptidyl-prolyl cis-trans isomerase Pin1 [Kickxella alabastrina]